MKSVKTFSQVAEKYNPENDHIFERACEILDERLDGAVGEYGCDLHGYVFNEIYAFDNDKLAEVAVDSVGVWSAMRLVKKYVKRSSSGSHLTKLLIQHYGKQENNYVSRIHKRTKIIA